MTRYAIDAPSLVRLQDPITEIKVRLLGAEGVVPLAPVEALSAP